MLVQKYLNETINTILDEIKNCIIYIDDIIIYGKNKYEHNEILVEVLKRFQKYHVKINFDKSKFLTTKIEVLGNIIENGKIKIDTEKIDKLLNNDYINLI
ncbi:Retrovirus-related Pol polyprotein from transposon 17.6 [Dictyocoela muelleri]|nr:Retrovirus-related Pol polyprotein from transposon 17.6 [Dictyocoela muelleri]